VHNVKAPSRSAGTGGTGILDGTLPQRTCSGLAENSIPRRLPAAVIRPGLVRVLNLKASSRHAGCNCPIVGDRRRWRLRVNITRELRPVRVLLSRPDELGPTEIAAWQSMQRATVSLANPFLSPEFAVAVGRFRSAARVAVLYDGPSIVGFFPFERRRFGAGVPICGWPGTLCQGLVHAPGADWDPRDLLRSCQLSVWQFDHLAAGQKPFERYQTATAASPVIDLSQGFAAYRAQLETKSPRFSRDIARRARGLARDAGELRFVADSRDVNLLRTLMAWKSEQYRRIAAIDRFDRPWVVGLLDALHATRGDHVNGALSAVYAGDQPVAAQFGMRSGNVFGGWFTAYDPRFAKYSPGLVQFLRMTEELAAVGVHTIDLGEGAAPWKERLKSHDIFVGSGIVTGRSLLAAAHRVSRGTAERAAQALFHRPRLYHATRYLRSAVR
jgi:CelD/BcsL family acetyltransferase involved in cellulose biosynthesis